MKAVSQGDLQSFEQTMLGAKVHVFGDVAIAFRVCRNLENGVKEVRSVEAYLLIKQEGAWRIVSQAWDTESESKTIPQYLLAK